MARSFVAGVLLACLFMHLGAATDYDVSASPGPGEMSLEACLKKLVENDKCLLKPGHYYASPSVVSIGKTKFPKVPMKNIVIAAKPWGDVLIDGTKELTLSDWKNCTEEDASLSCAEGVFVTNLGSQEFSQLFLGGDDALKRRLLFPARWPNALPATVPNNSGLPEWASVTDTYASWSFPDGSKSGRMSAKHGTPDLKDREPGAYAKFVDTGGSTIHVEGVEVEEGMKDTIYREGPGFLNETNVSVRGATIVVVYGKGSTESGVVYKHQANSNEFEFEHPNCNTEGYGSCKKGFWKDEFVSYFFENTLSLLDQPFEYFFERRKKGGNRLFLKLNGVHKPSVRLWGRHSDYFLNVKGSDKFTVRGIKTFATCFKAEQTNQNFSIEDSTFLYASVSSRLLGDHGMARGMVISGAHDGSFRNNVWMYAEGTALDANGFRMTMTDNLFRYNGIYSNDGPQTIKWSSVNGTVSHNSLEWNGHVTGWKFMGEGQMITKNDVQHQNWGKCLHDGAGLHVQMSAGASEFSYNWVRNGHKSLGIRFDTAKTSPFTKPEDVGHDAQVHHNVIWGTGTNLAMKGERMTVKFNTIFGGSLFSLIRAFGVQQGMHELTTASKNALDTPLLPRGKHWSGRRRTPGCQNTECLPGANGWKNEPDDETKQVEPRPQGVEWPLPPKIKPADNLIYADLCWDGLIDCQHHDFRPLSPVTGNGAYEDSSDTYWLPGRRHAGPSSPMPEDGAVEVIFDARVGLAFVPSATCKTHRLSLTWPGRKRPKQTMLNNGANLWKPGRLPKNTLITWTAAPAAGEPGCEGAPATSWTFTTAQNKRTSTIPATTTTTKTKATTTTTRTTTTIAPPCVDLKQGSWCATKASEGKCSRNNVKNRCAKTCGLCCEDETPEGVTAAKNKVWCEKRKSNGQCYFAQAVVRCKLTCELCTPSLVVVSEAAEAGRVQKVQAHAHDIEKPRRKIGFLQRITHDAKSMVQLSANTARSLAYSSSLTEDDVIGDQSGKVGEL